MKAHLHPSLDTEQKYRETKKAHIYLDSKFERCVPGAEVRLQVEGTLALRSS